MCSTSKTFLRRTIHGMLTPEVNRLSSVMGWITKTGPAVPGNPTTRVVEAHGRG